MAAEVTPDNARIRCAICAGEIAAVPRSAVAPRTRDARALLKRWASGDFLDPYGPVVDSPAAENQPAAKERTPDSQPAAAQTAHASHDRETQSKSQLRFDVPHKSITSGPHEPPDRHAGQGAPFRVPPPPPLEHHSDPEHQAPSPHFRVREIIARPTSTRTHWGSLIGQLFAYVGVAMLTVGMVLAIWGYFGGPDRYTPTGWLIATAGQMLLYLGVVTLISGGMEQTTQEVTRRIEILGERIIRIEQASSGLRGPNIPAERFQHRRSEAALAESPTTSDRIESASRST